MDDSIASLHEFLPKPCNAETLKAAVLRACGGDEPSQADPLEALVAEERVFGVNHAAVGAHLLRLWELPLPVIDSIAWHHEPSRAKQKGFNALTAVHAANVIVHRRTAKDPKTARPFDLAYLAGLGLSHRVDDWINASDED